MRQDDPIACEGEDGGYKPPGSEGEGGEGEDGWELRRLLYPGKYAGVRPVNKHWSKLLSTVGQTEGMTLSRRRLLRPGKYAGVRNDIK